MFAGERYLVYQRPPCRKQASCCQDPCKDLATHVLPALAVLSPDSLTRGRYFPGLARLVLSIIPTRKNAGGRADTLRAPQSFATWYYQRKLWVVRICHGGAFLV